MSTIVRPEISKKNKYWISKHRYYELKHFCLQYPIWKSAYLSLNEVSIPLSMIGNIATRNGPGDPTGNRAVLKAYYKDKIDLIERVAIDTDRYLYEYLLKAVTEELSYTYLRSKLDIPCGRDMYYERYRKFFWLLSEARD